MADIATNIAIVQTKAAELDALVAQFRETKTAIDAAELAIRTLRPYSDPTKAFQERLALFGHARMIAPSAAGEKPLAQIAAAAWAGVV
ncbi:hypothetical protein [Sinorhizobium meliloti]|uniref:hypothetical protein n=1 Tax=Rhizobium meliloti TaxID=382 RepID=UPI0003DD8866|nr:hypothetical protein [Sinorhizobium meliloti]ARS70115.1 hypothetical protein SMRU11_23980 [Sinorhizobium meliloti RU11/001]